LGTNSKYLAEVIRRSGYQSFYDMISQHRVRHAISLIHQHPDERLADIADRCGFSSQASMTKAFKAQGKETPSTYRGM
jgi:AraC-like DNA-binding protein